MAEHNYTQTPARAPRRFVPGVLSLVISASLSAQEPAEPVRLVDSPTAGLIAKGRFGIDLRLFPDGGMLGQMNAGVLKRVSIGISFGGTHLIGDEKIDWYPRVETAARYRLIEESQGLPAVTIGFETQGFGRYRDGRYQVKSKGLFCAFSKNYASGFGQVGWHGGVNFTREDRDDGGPSGWAGIDKRINEELTLVGEYDFGLDDNADNSLGSGKGYLNLGAEWSAVPGVTIGFLLKNVLQNGKQESALDGGVAAIPSGPDPDLSREISIRYTEGF